MYMKCLIFSVENTDTWFTCVWLCMSSSVGLCVWQWSSLCPCVRLWNGRVSVSGDMSPCSSTHRPESRHHMNSLEKLKNSVYIVKLPKISNKINVHVVYWIPCASPPPSIFNLIYWQHHHTCTCILAYSSGYNKHT